jgi:aryl-alcohol dehydrogenase-like predicted oxidoreductase
LKIVDRLKQVGEQRNKTSAQAAIRWVLHHPAVKCAIVGAKSPRQIEQNTGASGWRLSDHEYRFISGRIPTLK